jgi:leucyl aminopeptidase
MIDLATLTGAITVTFGSLYCGLFSNNDKLADQLLTIGKNINEKLWRLPLHEDYDKYIVSQTADIQNKTNDKGAGSIVAAQFLQKFVNNVPWVHLDIAGVAWTKKDLDIIPKGATAFALQLLNKFVEEHCE